jgi:hypothetical protein
VKLVLSAPSYELGDLVSFSVTNESKSLVHLYNAYWWQITDSLGTWLDPCEQIPIVIDLHPGYSFAANWGQTTCGEGSQVRPGRYRIAVPYYFECCPGERSVEAFFDIGLSPVEPATWGGIKATFR